MSGWLLAAACSAAAAAGPAAGGGAPLSAMDAATALWRSASSSSTSAGSCTCPAACAAVYSLCAPARVQTHERRPRKPLSTALATLQLPCAASPCAGCSSEFSSSHARAHARRLPTAASYTRRQGSYRARNAGRTPSIIIIASKAAPAQHLSFVQVCEARALGMTYFFRRGCGAGGARVFFVLF